MPDKTFAIDCQKFWVRPAFDGETMTHAHGSSASRGETPAVSAVRLRTETGTSRIIDQHHGIFDHAEPFGDIDRNEMLTNRVFAYADGFVYGVYGVCFVPAVYLARFARFVRVVRCIRFVHFVWMFHLLGLLRLLRLFLLFRFVCHSPVSIFLKMCGVLWSSIMLDTFILCSGDDFILNRFSDFDPVLREAGDAHEKITVFFRMGLRVS